RLLPDTRSRVMAGFALVGGLIAPLSRGPWGGALLTAALFFLVRERSAPRPPPFALGGPALVALVVASGAAGDLLRGVPIFGSVDAFNVTYRERLLQIALDEIGKSPFFGGQELLYSPAFQELVQGEGFVDFVNTYVAIALTSGLVGLGL